MVIEGDDEETRVPFLVSQVRWEETDQAVQDKREGVGNRRRGGGRLRWEDGDLEGLGEGW